MFMHEFVHNAPIHFLHMSRMLRVPEGQTFRRPDHVFWYNIIFEAAGLLFILQATFFN
jgi:hypothetical protein